VVWRRRAGPLGTVTLTVLERRRPRARADVALPGQVVLVKGAGFQGQKLSARSGVVATELEVTAEGVRVTIPGCSPRGTPTTLELQAGTAAPREFDLYIGRLPLVIEVSPRRGAVGDGSCSRGAGSGPTPCQHVTFAAQPALVLSATETELAVVAPRRLPATWRRSCRSW